MTSPQLFIWRFIRRQKTWTPLNNLTWETAFGGDFRPALAGDTFHDHVAACLRLVLEVTSDGHALLLRRNLLPGSVVRNIIECVRALFGDTDFAPYLFVVPERHYADKDQTVRLYHNMHTGKWWWSTQKQVENNNPGATIIPILLSSDKTQLTMFGNKSAYPVYMTIGNIPKEIRRKPSRRAYILLAYLPTSRLGHIKNKAARRRTLANLFHACLSFITAPLRDAGVNGIPIASGDGKLPRGHPIVACYIGDYPEQLLVTCVKTGWRALARPSWMLAVAAFLQTTISAYLNRVTGREHDQISCFLLGIIIDVKLPGGLSPLRLVEALEDARMTFHRNKGIFVDLRIREGFNLPKLHSMEHYPQNIMNFGTSDNYNTEYTERLHIDLAKDAYRSTNRKDEFSQMTLWLERKEKVLRHGQFVDWKSRGSPAPPIIENLNPGIIYERKLTMSKHPTHKSVKFNVLEATYGAPFFRDTLSRYVVGLMEPGLSAA
ncbi:hypothetical protein B0H14DRAFT_3454023 [Mycena olivaceomarginata]|nr:hypothetical protein B0H14DRAFT_3454023 [Mycena olivaceomarginata]